MKDERLTPHPDTECLTGANKCRVYFNKSTKEIECSTIYEADYVEVDALTREDVVVAVIRSKYSLNKELSIRREYINNQSGATEKWNEFCEFVEFAKGVANTLGL